MSSASSSVSLYSLVSSSISSEASF
uniref:Uncharacterized protein n=1 Tax=Arundo donax TaxID=35708 RepID=A0A0A8YJH1_ARUDO